MTPTCRAKRQRHHLRLLESQLRENRVVRLDLHHGHVMARANTAGHKIDTGDEQRWPPGAANVDVLADIAIRQLDAELRCAPVTRWPSILAERQVAPFHVRSLGTAIGLRLTADNLWKLRQVAATALASCDLEIPTERLARTAGAAMRAAIADHLAERCSLKGPRLLRRVTEGRLPDPRLRSMERADWRALIVERWKVLPIMRPVDIAGFLSERLSSPEPEGLEAASSAAERGASTRPALAA